METHAKQVPLLPLWSILENGLHRWSGHAANRDDAIRLMMRRDGYDDVEDAAERCDTSVHQIMSELEVLKLPTVEEFIRRIRVNFDWENSLLRHQKHPFGRLEVVYCGQPHVTRVSGCALEYLENGDWGFVSSLFVDLCDWAGGISFEELIEYHPDSAEIEGQLGSRIDYFLKDTQAKRVHDGVIESVDDARVAVAEKVWSAEAAFDAIEEMIKRKGGFRHE